MKRTFATVLAAVLIGGSFSTVGAQKVHAGPASDQGTQTEPKMALHTVAGTGVKGTFEGDKASLSQMDTPTDLAIIELGGDEHLLVANDPGTKEIWMINSKGNPNPLNGRDYVTFQLKDSNGIVLKARDIAYDSRKKVLYFTGSPDNGPAAPTVFALDVSNGITDNSTPLEVKTLIPGNDPDLPEPKGLDVSSVTGDVYTADYQNISGFIIETGETFADIPVKKPDVQYDNLMAIQITSQVRWKNGIVLFQEAGSYYFMQYDDAGRVVRGDGSSLPGGVVEGAFSNVEVALDQQYNVYAANQFDNRIYRVAKTSNQNSPIRWEVIIGSGIKGLGLTNQSLLATDLDSPRGVAVAANGTVYISDTGNHRILKVAPYQESPASATAIAGDASADVSWSAVTDAVSYKLYQYQGDTPPVHENDWKYVNEIPASSTSSKVTGLDNGKSYFFAVKAKGVNSTSAFSPDSNAVTPQRVPYAYEQEVIDDETWNLVKSPADLDHMRDDLGGNYKLVRDLSAIELNEYLIEKNGENNWTPIGNGKEAFYGQFDGGNHTIDGLTISSQSGGLFGDLHKAKVGYLRLTGLNISSFQTTGGLAASAYNSEIFRVSVEGEVGGGRNVGGLIGSLRDSNIGQSYFNGSVRGWSNIGGLIGNAEFNADNGPHVIQDNYVWGSVSQMYLPRMTSNDVTITNSDMDHFAGFVGLVSSDLSSSDIPIFKNNYVSVKTVITSGLGDFSELWSFAGSDLGQEPLPSISNYWNTKANAGVESFVVHAKALNDEEMKVQANFTDWDFSTVWTMDQESGYPVLRAFTAGQPTNPTEPTNPAEPTNPTNPVTPPTTPSTGGGTSTPVVTTPASNTTIINVNVQNDKTTNGSIVASLAITRTKGTDGTTKDALQLTPAKATEIINLLKASGSKTAAIVLPDAGDEVSQWDLTVPGAASKLLTGEGIELVILNPNVRITVPASSLTDLTDDLYFRLIPVKSTATSSEIQARALANPEIVAAANGGSITVVGRPMTIETNLQSRPVTLTLPLPAGSSFTAAQQKKLGVYIEHSDGTKQLVPGKVVTQEDGKLGIEITVSHFSTFTIVNVSNWGSTLTASPYIMGYADGSFKPAQNITRAELAAIVGRITGVTEGAATFSDVKNGSWASTVVGPAAASDIMTGYSDGTFKPNASITRGELASALAKLLPQSGLNASGQAAGFSDLAASHWAAAAAAQLQAAGVVTGYADGSFKPEQNVTRAEAVTMINRLVGLDGSMALPGAAAWSDVTESYWAYDAVRAASMQR